MSGQDPAAAPAATTGGAADTSSVTTAGPAETVLALLWLCVGTVAAAFIAVIWLPLWVAGLPVPVTILVAVVGNVVLVRTAARWSTAWCLLPVGVWLLTVLVLAFWPGDDRLVGMTFRSFLLVVLGAGVPTITGLRLRLDERIAALQK